MPSPHQQKTSAPVAMFRSSLMWGNSAFGMRAPEATYLVVYVESLDLFLGRDVRDIVDERWGPGILAPENLRDQASVTVHLPLDAVFDESAVELASRAHRSMRIDGPTFRGRPLGHRFDPLRSELSPLEPDAFERLVSDLLNAHQFRTASEVDATRLVANVAPNSNHVRVFTGTFWTTYEYIFAGSVELGFGPDVEPRMEGQTFRAFGRSMVVVHSRVANSIQPAEDVLEFVAELADREGCENFLVFANCEDHAHNMLLPWRRSIFGGRTCVPQGLRSLAFNVLTATLVYLDNAENLSWKSLQYNLSADAAAVAERFRRMSEGVDLP
jgi:hypothetical protein